MQQIDVEIVDAFVDGGAGGNPAGVVVEGAAALTPAQRQQVARDLAISETAFVLPSATADVRLEFYTPSRPIAHCGHATVGSFARLAALGRLRGAEVVNETVDGPRRIRIEGASAFLEQVPARLEPVPASVTAEIRESLGIAADALLPDGPILADNGNRTILVGVASAAILGALQPDQARIKALTERFDAVCYYVFALDARTPGRDATARMFGPAYGIPEEAATGMAAGPLACLLDRRTGGDRDGFRIEQGHFMAPPSPSLILARPERSGGRLSAMWVGGAAQARLVRQVAFG